jgi:hypothetical protein
VFSIAFDAMMYREAWRITEIPAANFMSFLSRLSPMLHGGMFSSSFLRPLGALSAFAQCP